MMKRVYCMAVTGLLGMAGLSLAAVTNQVDLAGGKRLTVLAEGMDRATNRAWRLCVLLPGGAADPGLAASAMAGVGREFAARDWAVVVPVSPDGKPFFGAGRSWIVELVESLRAKPGTDPSRIVLAGLSNGAIAALEIASRNPGICNGVVAIPGMSSNHVKAEGLKGLPVFLRIGEKDELGWGRFYAQVVDQLRDGGARLDAKLVPGADHGVAIDWTELDAWLKTLKELPAKDP